ncbi:MAG TPA: hypothetical protein VJX92_15615 [Methylomirabilota bacterium]|nr:hypothetical protein [Methylomirabilota bacterium]
MSTRINWGKIFRLTASGGFMASAALHLATFTSLPPGYRAAGAVVLLVVAFVLLGAVIVSVRDVGAPARGQGALRVVDWRRLLALIPEGPRRAGFAVILYVLMNLVLSLLVADEAVGGARLLSGHLLLFYLIPLMYFRFVEPRLRDGGGPSRP